MISTTIAQLFENHGTNITVTKGVDEKTVKAFIQPLRYKNKMYVDGNFLPAGYINGGHFLYIGPPTVSLNKNPHAYTLKTNDEEFVVKRAEKYTYRNSDIYIWAILTPLVKE